MRRLIVVLVAVGAVTGCGGGSSAPTELTVTGAWSRPTPETATKAVVYLTINADIDDALTGGSVDRGVARDVTIHASADVASGGSSHHGDEASDQPATMVQTEAIPVTAGEPTAFAPGGNHIMLTDLAAPLVEGDTFTLTLQLASGRTPEVSVVVANNPPVD